MPFNMKVFLTLITLCFISTAFSQNTIVRGFLYSDESGEALAFEKVKILNAADSSVVTGAVTDINGFFSIPKIEQGEYIIAITSYKYDAIYEPIVIDRPSGIIDNKFMLKKQSSIQDMDEVVVSAESKQKKTEILMSQIKLDKKGIERIPSMGAENDIVGAFSVTPGVVTTGDQGGQMYVRGGTPIQNKILLDGMTIYSPFHSIGFFSVFETELIKSADIYTGGFDAKYGGRISSIMDITYRDGNRKKISGKISGSPFLAKAVVEGPLSKGKNGELPMGSFLLSGKHSILDRTSQALYPNINNGNGLPFEFTDLYGKITMNSNAGSKISLSGFNNVDQVSYPEASINWNSYGGGLNFIMVPGSSPVFIKGHLNGSKYSTIFKEEGATPRESSIGGIDVGFDFTYFLANEGEFNYGINLGAFETNFSTVNESFKEIGLFEPSTEIGLYLNYRKVVGRWVFQPGLRLQSYATYSTNSLEPRFGAKYNATENVRLKISGGRYSQNFTSASNDKDVVNIFNGLLSAPTNVQSEFLNEFGKLREVSNGIQYAWHAIVGTEIDLTKKLSANIEGYYKYFPQLSNINPNKVYEDNAQNNAQPDYLKKDFIIESGQSYGIDFLFKYSEERLFLWAVYSYGLSERWDGFESYNPVFDRRHNINLVGTYLFGKNKDLEVNVRWNFGSGLPYTPTSALYQSESFSGGVTTDYTTSNPNVISTQLGEFNSQRLPTYHRFDFTFKKRIEMKKGMEFEFIFNVTNLYNRQNIFYVNRVTNKTIYQFPLLPSAGLSLKF
jgi:hypothetical protein